VHIDKQLLDLKRFVKQQATSKMKGNLFDFLDQLDFTTQHILEAFDCKIAKLSEQIVP